MKNAALDAAKRQVDEYMESLESGQGDKAGYREWMRNWWSKPAQAVLLKASEDERKDATSNAAWDATKDKNPFSEDEEDAHHQGSFSIGGIRSPKYFSVRVVENVPSEKDGAQGDLLTGQGDDGRHDAPRRKVSWKRYRQDKAAVGTAINQTEVQEENLSRVSISYERSSKFSTEALKRADGDLDAMLIDYADAQEPGDD